VLNNRAYLIYYLSPVLSSSRIYSLLHRHAVHIPTTNPKITAMRRLSYSIQGHTPNCTEVIEW